MTDDTKLCPICATVFPHIAGSSAAKWQQQMTCSKECGYAYRKTRPEGDHAVSQSRERSKAAMNRNWRIKKDMAAAKASLPMRVPREDEEALMARFIEERGVTRVDPGEAVGELGAGRVVAHPDTRPMPGWR